MAGMAAGTGSRKSKLETLETFNMKPTPLMMSFPYKATSPNPPHTAPPAGETSVQIPGTAGLSHSDPQWESTCLHSVCRVQFSAKKREHEERKEDRRE